MSHYVTMTVQQLTDMATAVSEAAREAANTAPGGEPRIAAYRQAVARMVDTDTWRAVSTPALLLLLGDDDRQWETVATVALMGRALSPDQAELAMSALGWFRWDGPVDPTAGDARVEVDADSFANPANVR
jgi:hypothetical protein